VQVPEELKAALAVTDVVPSEDSPGGVVVVKGQGFQPGATAKLGNAAIEKVVLSSDGTTAAGLIPAHSGGADLVDVPVANPGGSTVTLSRKFRFSGQKPPSVGVADLGNALSLTDQIPQNSLGAGAVSPHCTDQIWPKGIVNSANADWMVAARNIKTPDELDQTKKFTDYGIAFPTFLQLCNRVTGSINKTLEDEPCTQRMTLPDIWRPQHHGDTILAFIGAAVDLILKPTPAATV